MKRKDVIKIVSLFDKDAAKYLKEHTAGETLDIIRDFQWNQTPQGDTYWCELSLKVQAVINTVEFYK